MWNCLWQAMWRGAMLRDRGATASGLYLVTNLHGQASVIGR